MVLCERSVIEEIVEIIADSWMCVLVKVALSHEVEIAEFAAFMHESESSL